jgi:hypothetical protein
MELASLGLTASRLFLILQDPLRPVKGYRRPLTGQNGSFRTQRPGRRSCPRSATPLVSCSSLCSRSYASRKQRPAMVLLSLCGKGLLTPQTSTHSLLLPSNRRKRTRTSIAWRRSSRTGTVTRMSHAPLCARPTALRADRTSYQLIPARASLFPTRYTS